MQYECIACAACIDVCDQVMDKMGYDRGLVRYTTEHALKHKEAHVVRPRILVYATLLFVLISGTLWAMTNRVPLRADMIRDRNALYRELPGDMIENVYTLKITNMDAAAHRYSLTATNNDQVQIDLDRSYRILSNGFLVDYAGDGYYWFGAHGSAFENTHSTFATIMTEIIANEGALNPTEPDGRLTILR